MNPSEEVQADPMLEKRTRRRFSGPEKQRLLAQFDTLDHGEKGAWLRRQGLFAAQFSTWRKELREHGTAGLAPKATGRKPADPRDQRIEQLEREVAKLAKRTRIAEALVDLQKKVLSLMEDAQSEELKS